MTQSVVFQAVVQLTRTVDVLPINERLMAVRVETQGAIDKDSDDTTKRQFGSMLTANAKEMVLTPENLKLLLAGKPYTAEPLVAASEAFLLDAQTKGYPEAVQTHLADGWNANIYTRVKNGEKLRMVRLDHGGHMLFDDQGTVLPIALHYDYMNGNMRDGAYDLHGVAEYLKNNPQVRPWDEQTSLTVDRVPYYNVSPGCTQSLAFVFAPTQEQMERIWAKANEGTGEYPSTRLHQSVWELDVLGLRAAGLAKGTSYWDSGDHDTTEESEDD